jgi:hypothetical protein
MGYIGLTIIMLLLGIAFLGIGIYRCNKAQWSGNSIFANFRLFTVGGMFLFISIYVLSHPI